MYSLNWNQPGRRTGLTRDGYKAPNLLQSINSPNNRNTMRQKKPQSSLEESMKPVNEVLSEEGIYAPPKDQSDSSDEENASRAADIIPTVFIRRGSEDSNVNSQKSKGAAREGRGKGSSPLPERKAASSIKTTRSSRRLSPGSSSKRKNGENDVQLGTGLVDQFGQFKKAKAGKTYGLASHKRHTIRPQQQHNEGMLENSSISQFS